MISRSSGIFYRFGNDQILPKKVRNYVRNYARYTKPKIISSGLCWDV